MDGCRVSGIGWVGVLICGRGFEKFSSCSLFSLLVLVCNWFLEWKRWYLIPLIQKKSPHIQMFHFNSMLSGSVRFWKKAKRSIAIWYACNLSRPKETYTLLKTFSLPFSTGKEFWFATEPMESSCLSGASKLTQEPMLLLTWLPTQVTNPKSLQLPHLLYANPPFVSIRFRTYSLFYSRSSLHCYCHFLCDNRTFFIWKIKWEKLWLCNWIHFPRK